MSRTRTTPDSPREITDPKRRSFDKDHSDALFSTRATPDSSREISDSKRIDLDIDRVRAFLRSFPPPVKLLSPIAMLIDDYSIRGLAKILVNSEEIVEKAKAAIQILKDGILFPDQGVEKLTNAVREFWLSPCFVKGLRTAQEKYAGVVCPILHFANEDTAHQRWKLMKADPLFEPFLTSLDSDFDIMRLFLSILIGCWANKAELTKLDAAMGKEYFGEMMTLQALAAREEEEKKKNGVEEEVKEFMYKIEDADGAKNLEHVQEWLVSEYLNDKYANTEALFKEIKSEISLQVKTNQEAGLYNGKNAKINIYIKGCNPLVSMECRGCHVQP